MAKQNLGDSVLWLRGIGNALAFVALLSCCGTGGSSAPGALPAPTPEPGSGAALPNIVVIMGDDIGWPDYGFQGSPALTPTIDRLAAEGTVFQQMHLSASVCQPTHRHLLTGRHPMKPWSRATDPTLPEMLRDAGYRTWQAGKLWERTAEAWGFAESAGDEEGGIGNQTGTVNWGRTGWDVEACGQAKREENCPATASWRRFLQSRTESSAPFFALLTPELPHSPVNPPQEYVDLYPGMEDTVQNYYAMLTWLDTLLGAVLTDLDRLTFGRETIILYFADNGWKASGGTFQGLQPEEVGSKSSLHELGFRSPAIVHGATIPAGVQRNDLVSLDDLVATILGYAHATPLAGTGIDLSEYIQSGAPSPRTEIVTWFRNLRGRIDGYIVRTDDWRYIREESNGTQMLYAIPEDPFEENNRIDSADPKEVARFEDLIEAWEASLQQ
ncbi:MAG: sulfatase-like hydrolase/transferase [Deltaproteobacteria bacterium]